MGERSARARASSGARSEGVPSDSGESAFACSSSDSGVCARDARARLGPLLGEAHQALDVVGAEHTRGFAALLAFILAHHAQAPHVAGGQRLDLVQQRRPSLLREVDARRRRARLAFFGLNVETRVAQTARRRALARAPRRLRQKHVARVAVQARHDEHAAAVRGDAETYVSFAFVLYHETTVFR
jgi:hypothetical protein